MGEKSNSYQSGDAPRIPGGQEVELITDIQAGQFDAAVLDKTASVPIERVVAHHPAGEIVLEQASATFQPAPNLTIACRRTGDFNEVRAEEAEFYSPAQVKVTSETFTNGRAGPTYDSHVYFTNGLTGEELELEDEVAGPNTFEAIIEAADGVEDLEALVGGHDFNQGRFSRVMMLLSMCGSWNRVRST